MNYLTHASNEAGKLFHFLRIIFGRITRICRGIQMTMSVALGALKIQMTPRGREVDDAGIGT